MVEHARARGLNVDFSVGKPEEEDVTLSGDLELGQGSGECNRLLHGLSEHSDRS